MLVGREPGVPFGRPPLSKTYLRSEEELSGWYVRSPGWYDEHDVERLESERRRGGRGRPRRRTRLGPRARVSEGPDRDGRTEPATFGSGSGAGRDPLPPHGRRVRRDQARGGCESQRGGSGDGVHRVRGGCVPDAARGSGDRQCSPGKRRWKRCWATRSAQRSARSTASTASSCEAKIRSLGSKGPSASRRP